ncbi:MAG: ABC transporter ATP-binding protein [Planctomycetota bacterium]|nr:ABC transporter ATP-binding protein [Planctomycetota bacterium]MDA0933640.1 ABC transporter ATP-binding protein [Planctomycetota bacterium]MDA1221750.1 ABC transporter ATP-binding protein [Planctomycetota bacterium]
MTRAILEASAVTKSYAIGSRSIPVLRGVDLSIGEGEVVALLGASGAGKSTLLHVLGLLDPPSSGRVLFEGRPVHDLPIRERASLRHRQIGFVFQFYHLIPELNALENVKLGTMMDRGLLSWMKDRRELDERARDLLRTVGLTERHTHRPSELSGGERQRVAIARALIARPKVILADEPTGNLDSETAAGVLDLLFRINREEGVAFLMVTHDERLAERCDRLIRMKDGVVVS